MITPEQVRAKATRLYEPFVEAWLAGKEFFPRNVPADTTPSPSISQAIAEQQLNSLEAAAFQLCRDNAWRLEQERLPQTFVNQQLALLGQVRSGEQPV